MTTNLEDFYKKIQNPILDEANFDKLIEAYANHNFLDSKYKGNMDNVYATGSSVYSPDEFEAFYARIFNYWKKHLVTSHIPNTSPLYSLQQYFKDKKDVSNWKEAVAAFPNKRKTQYLYKFFDTSSDSQRVNSVEIHEQDNETKHTPFNVEHFLYVNVDLEYLHKFANKFLDKCEEKNLPYLFEIKTNFKNDKPFTVCSDSKHLLEYYQILQEIVREDKDLKEHIYHPPIFSGIVDGWIGYESIAMNLNKSNEEFSHLILSKAFKKKVVNQPRLALVDEDGEDVNLIYLASSNVVYKQLDYLSKLDCKQLKDYYNLKPGDLKKKKFLNFMFAQVKAEILKGIKDNNFHFNDVTINYNKKKLLSRKRNNANITIKHKDLEKVLSKTFQDVVRNYPELKSSLQQGILKMAGMQGMDSTTFCMTNNERSLFRKKRKSKKATHNQKKVFDFSKTDNTKLLEDKSAGSSHKTQNKPLDFSKLIGTSDVKMLENKTDNDSSSYYHLTKDQIIQDLPIHSKEKSRFDGIMTDDEINESRIKLGFISGNIHPDTTYRLKKDQIIQDLPIHSKQPSRFQGVMTDKEIQMSREKIKVYCKK